MPRNSLFSRFSMKNFLAQKYQGGVAAPWYGGKNFSWKSARTVNSYAFVYAESVSDIGFPWFCPLTKFALANSCTNPAKWPFWNPKVNNARPWAAIILGMYLGACNEQMLLTAAGSEEGDLVHFPCEPDFRPRNVSVRRTSREMLLDPNLYGNP